MLIKVCGMRDAANISAVAALDIDYMGFIFWSRSKRYAAAPDLSGCRRKIMKTGVFVNASREEIMERVDRFGLDAVQLHGQEEPELCRAIRNRGLRTIKAFAIADESDLQHTADYEGTADYFLFDTKTSGYGGSGRVFDWSILSRYTGETPFFLSGGLNPDSLEALRRFRHPQWAGIDLNSGFESSPGMKDATLLRSFISNIRQPFV